MYDKTLVNVRLMRFQSKFIEVCTENGSCCFSDDTSTTYGYETGIF